MHMLSRKDLNSAELETVRVSRNPTTVIISNGEVQTNDEATVCACNTENYVPIVVPGLSTGSSSSRAEITPSTSVAQNSMRDRPANTRSRRNRHKAQRMWSEIQTKIKNEDDD